MNILTFLKLYGVALPVFFGIDMIWLGVVAKTFYRKHLGYLLASPPRWSAAILFYLLYIGGVIFFAVLPARDIGSASRAALYGALFGFFTYATYDLTNLATVRDWPLIVTIVDICWGTLLGCSVAFLTFLLSAKLRI